MILSAHHRELRREFGRQMRRKKRQWNMTIITDEASVWLCKSVPKGVWVFDEVPYYRRELEEEAMSEEGDEDDSEIISNQDLESGSYSQSEGFQSYTSNIDYTSDYASGSYSNSYSDSYTGSYRGSYSGNMSGYTDSTSNSYSNTYTNSHSSSYYTNTDSYTNSKSPSFTNTFSSNSRTSDSSHTATNSSSERVIEERKLDIGRGGPKIHLWSGISVNGATPLYMFHGNMNSKVYVRILSRRRRAMEELFPDGFIFQQDNHPVHKSRRSMAYIRRTFDHIMSWPPCSPDLSPIENVWAWLKAEVSKDFPETLQELRASLLRHWERVTPEFLAPYFRSLPRRIDTMLDGDGARIEC